MSPRCFPALAILSIFGPFVSPVPASPIAQATTRLINPLPLPDYPVGRLVRDLAPGKPNELGGLWLAELTQQYRELADPSGLWFEGKWYLYPSCDMA